MMVGVRFENKGMETDATVKNYHMEAVPNVDGSGKIIGAFTGKVNTEVDLNYGLSRFLPLTASTTVGKLLPDPTFRG